jgi:hypothetical protein
VSRDSPADPVPAWLDDLVLGSGPPWLHMGLRTIPEEQWLDVDARRDDELALKRRLLAERHDDVFAALPGFEYAGAEVLALVRSALGDRTPEPDDDRHPLEAASLLVQEDLCLMAMRDGTPHLVAASLCFPSHWRLADKIGRSADAMHQPVAHYRTELSAKVDRYLERIPAGRISLRRNWAVHDHDTLYVPDYPPPAAGITADTAGDRLWLRSERQTLRRLPRSGAVLFTIRVQLVRLAVLAQRPDVAAELAASARAGSAVGRERVSGGHLDAACAWLEAQGPAPVPQEA